MATTKRELVKRIADRTGYRQQVAQQVVQAFLDEIIEQLARGQRIEFREFGVFNTVRRAPRIARNPRTGKPIEVSAKTVVKFKVGRLMKSRVQRWKR